MRGVRARPPNLELSIRRRLFEAQTIPNITPGSDVTYCQYVAHGFDHDVDVLHLSGYQSEWGHQP